MRTTVDLDDELNARLRRLVTGRGLNRFVNEAVAEKVAAIEKDRVRQAMREGYLATATDRAGLNRDWEVVDVEGWPE